MRVSKYVGQAVLALAIAGVVSMEAPAAAPASKLDFLSVDADKDGKVSPAEVQYIDDLRSQWDTLDENKDDFLTPPEYSKWSRAGKVKEMLPLDPSTGPSGSNGAQHMPKSK